MSPSDKDPARGHAEAKTTRLFCSKCKARGEIGCDCGVEYIRAGELATQAIADPENAGKSDRAIAEEIGVGSNTVRRARESTAPNGAVEKRTGKDGKARKLPKKPKPTANSDRPVAAYAADELGSHRYCSFCCESENEVRALIASRTTAAHICDECVAACVGVIKQKLAKPAVSATHEPDLYIPNFQRRVH
jgi:hypothetical protein